MAQTRAAPEQVTWRGAAAWCAAPSLLVEDTHTLVVGPAWASSRPCFVHFNVTPPGGVDPIHVLPVSSPARVRLSPASSATMNEQLYIWAAIPASAAAPVIQVGVRSLQLYTCEGCQLVPHHSEPRAFPARTIPIGFALVATGQFRAQVHDILSTHQIFVGAETGLVVHYTDGGYLLSIPPAGAMQAQAEAMRLRVQLASSAAVARSLEEQPPPMQRMTRLEKRLERLEVYLLALDERILPRKPEVLSVRSDLQEMIRGLQGEMEAVRGQLAQARHEAEQMQLAAGASPR